MRLPTNHAALAVAILGWIVPMPAPGLGQPSPRIEALQAVIVEVEAGARTTPVVGDSRLGGGSTVTFLARATGGHAPRIVSDVTGWGEHVDGTFDFTVGRMTRVGRSEWYWLQVDVAPRARIEYLVAYGTADYRPDPYNPRRPARPGLASEFVMPGYLLPEELEDAPASPSGLLAEATLESPALGRSCRVAVYTPSGYRESIAHPVVVFLDLRAQLVSRVLDWLVAHGLIEPLVAVFVDPQPEGGQVGGAGTRTFIVEELPRWLASRYGVTVSGSRRAVVGISFRAKDALDAALAAPDVYGRLGLLIPGRRITAADIEGIARRSRRPLRAAILAGQYDQANLATARGLHGALARAGHDVAYLEVPEGHSPVTWRNHLRHVLDSLFGRARPLRGQFESGSD